MEVLELSRELAKQVPVCTRCFAESGSGGWASRLGRISANGQ